MNYNESLTYIHSIPKFRRPLGNAQLARLLHAAGDPQDKLNIVHIAGTNGKGSTAAMLNSVLMREGYRTGMFTSPFIEVFNERIQINSENIPDDELAEYTERVKTLMEENEAYVSEFAFITAIAFLYFYEHSCDYVILETGMGGALDATNIVKKPLLCVLTSISMDHTEYLGDTIEKIALEKCGIIKEGVPVVSYPNEAVRHIIEAEAKARNAPLVFAKVPQRTGGGFIYEGKSYELSLKGEYQPKNAAVVIEACRILNLCGITLSEGSVYDGLKNAAWPARYEFVRENIVIDGGHNPDGVHELVKTLKADGRGIIAVTAMMADKSVSECMAEIASCAKMICCTELNMPRCMKAAELAAYAGEKAVIEPSPEKAIAAAISEANGTALVCICGSLYLAGEAKKYLKQALDKNVIKL